jgi:hypothetical protein
VNGGEEGGLSCRNATVVELGYISEERFDAPESRGCLKGEGFEHLSMLFLKRIVVPCSLAWLKSIQLIILAGVHQALDDLDFHVDRSLLKSSHMDPIS